MRAVAIAAGAVAAGGALAILLAEPIQSGAWRLDHVLIPAVVAIAITAGHLVSGAARARSWLAAAGFALILAFRHDLSVAAVIASFVVLELGVGVSQTVSNDTIVASVPAAKAGAASAVSETAYELGAVIGTATLGTIFTAFYRNNIDVPAGLTPAQAADAGESIGGATSVAADLPAEIAQRLLDSARTAFDSGIAPTAIIAAALALAAAAIVAAAFRGQTQR